MVALVGRSTARRLQLTRFKSGPALLMVNESKARNRRCAVVDVVVGTALSDSEGTRVWLAFFLRNNKSKRGHTRDGYNMTRTAWPMALGGRLRRNLARTTPLEPWGRVILPQMTRNRLPSSFFFAARYT